MTASRTVKTLSALLVAMTLGALVLWGLETQPVRPTAQPLAVLGPSSAGAGEVVYGTPIPLQPVQWRYVVVHASAGGTGRVADGCHFLIAPGLDGDWRITATGHWHHQRAGRHIGGYWREGSVGVCLVGDFSRRPPPAEPFRLLVELVNTLQEACRISPDRVYLQRDLVAGSSSPGEAFPAERFSARLLPVQP